jgi:cation-transporting ATPase 13A2
LFIVTLPVMMNITIPKVFIGYRFLDFLAWSFPPTFPIYFNLAYSFSLVRLRRKGIVGTEPEKTVDAAKLKTMCFDKTGTLTQNVV